MDNKELGNTAVCMERKEGTRHSDRYETSSPVVTTHRR